MSKIVNITSKEDKDQKLQDIANSLEELKDVMAEVIEAYEEENADSRKMDTLTEALDALEDAYEAVNDVCCLRKSDHAVQGSEDRRRHGFRL